MDNLDLRIDGRYRLLRKLGQGGFGMVYEGINVDTQERVALKLEHISNDPSFVQCEADNYKLLSRGAGIPKVYWSGQECEYNVMVFDLLGPSLEDLFNYCGRRFSLKTVLMLADQLISRLEFIHKKGLIHRDIKPDNFLMGMGRHGNLVYITDLGLSIGEHAATARKSHSLVGSRRYASINGHIGAEQSQRDDLESLGYVLVYFLSGHLPWQGLKAKSGKEKDQLILESKRSTRTKELCLGLDAEFESYFNYIRSIEFNGEPEYARLRNSFRRLFVRKGFEFDYVFDWTILKFQEQRVNDISPRP